MSAKSARRSFEPISNGCSVSRRASQLLFKLLFRAIDKLPIPLRIDEWIRGGASLHSFILLVAIEIAGMRSQKQIARKRPQHAKRAPVIVGDARILGIVH